MPLDVLGCTRATLMWPQSMNLAWGSWVIFEITSWWGLVIAIFDLERGIPSNLESSAHADYVPALCTHRPSLLPIEWSGEYFRRMFNSVCCVLHADTLWTVSLRGRRSRNKVSVGEPAEGSFACKCDVCLGTFVPTLAALCVSMLVMPCFLALYYIMLHSFHYFSFVSDGCLGSRTHEGGSELCWTWWLADLSELLIPEFRNMRLVHVERSTFFMLS